MDVTKMFSDVGPKEGTPVEVGGDLDQFQRGSSPQPTVGAPNAVTSGGTRSHVGDGSADNRPANDSHQPGV